MSRITIRFAKPADAPRFEADGVVSGPLPPGDSWSTRIATWRVEQEKGRRAILVAEDASGLLGMVHVIFSFPPGYTDDEIANGSDIAMIESLRVRPTAPAALADKLVSDAQAVAKRRGVTTLTLCLPLESERAIAQAKTWGFTQFRLLPEARKLHVFFRKSVA